MKRVIAVMAASLLASAAAISGPAFADDRGGDKGASAHAPGQMKGDGESARDFAPGQLKADGESARKYAPGQQLSNDDDQNVDDDDQIAEDDDNEVDETETGSIGDTDLDEIISMIGSGGVDFSSIDSSTDVNVVDIGDMLEDDNRAAFDSTLAENNTQISQLRTDLGGLDLEGLSDDQIDDAVAARVEADGSLTVYVQ